MSKLYFLLSDVDTTREVVDVLRSHDITESDIHVIANENTTLDSLPDADITETSDVTAAVVRGAAAGGAVGLLAGIAAVAFPPVGLTIGGGALLVGAMSGASFGSWTAAMIGVSVPNSRLREFEEAIESGKILLLADVPDERDEALQQAVANYASYIVDFGVADSVPPVM